MSVELAFALRKNIKVIDASILMAGFVPNYESSIEKLRSSQIDLARAESAKDMIIDAIRNSEIKGYLFKSTARFGEEIEMEKLQVNPIIEDVLEHEIENIYIDTFEMKEWVICREFPEAFFDRFKNEITKAHTRQLEAQKSIKIESDLIEEYDEVPLSNTMKAAIAAIRHFRKNPRLLSKGTPKNVFIKWLTENYEEYGLITNKKTISETTIKDIAALLNWKKSGGAPKL